MLDKFKAWLRGSTAPIVEPIAQDAGRGPLQISDAKLAMARGKTPPSKPDPLTRSAEEVYKPYAYPASIAPVEMAMDHAGPSPVGMLTNWAASSLFHEGQGFFGFPYLAELLQRAEYRHACEIWSEHAVRKWIKFTGGSAAQRKAIEEEFKRLDVRTVAETWAYHDQAFGRGQIFLDFGDADKPAELATPLRLIDTKVSPRRPLKALKVVEPVWSAPGVYNTSNPLHQDFYKPFEWIVYGKRVHESRMLTMTSRPLSDMLKPAYAFAGLSLVQMMKPYVDNWLRTRQAVSDMVNSYSILNLKTDMSVALSGGDCADIFRRADMANETRDNRGLWLTDKDMEELENIAVPLSGLHELQQQAQEQLASVSRIPLSIYLQISPTGLNANSDGETRNFYADVHSLQEKNMRPGLTTILEAVMLSLFGKIVDGLTFEFLPLWEMDDKDKAEMRKADSDADCNYVREGIVSPEEVRERLSNDETSLYHGVDLTDPPPEPESDPADDKPPPAQDAWNEADHPRDPDGRFGTGGGAAKLNAAPTTWTSRAGVESIANAIPQLGKRIDSQQEAAETELKKTDSPFVSVKTINPAQLKTIQSDVQREKVLSFLTNGNPEGADLPLVIKGPDGLVLIDGNHRSNAALLSGQTIEVEVFDYDAWQTAEAAKAEEKRKANQPSSKELDDLLAELGLDEEGELG